MDERPSSFTEIEHLYDHHGRHWLQGRLPDGRLVRGRPSSYEFIAELGELRAATDYEGERVYVELPVEFKSRSVVTDFVEDEDRDWQALWRDETQKALDAAPLYEG